MSKKNKELSEVTRGYIKKKRILTLISCVLLFTPLLVALGFAGYDMAVSGTTTETIFKVSIFSSSVIIFGILTIIGLARKVVFKSSIWIMVIALYFLLDYALPFIIVFGFCQIIDELIVSPGISHYREKILINKEIDRRQ